MDLEKGKYKCYICLNNFNKIYFSYNNLYCDIKPVINNIYNGTNVFFYL